MALRIYVRKFTSPTLLQLITQASLDATFDAALGAAMADSENAAIVVLDTTGTTPAARYMVVRDRRDGWG